MPSSSTRGVSSNPPAAARTYPICSSVSRIRARGGACQPVAAAHRRTSDMTGWRGWKSLDHIRPRARDSMKSGLVSRRGMGVPPLPPAVSLRWLRGAGGTGCGAPGGFAQPPTTVARRQLVRMAVPPVRLRQRREHCHLTPAIRSANVPVGPPMAATRTYVRQLRGDRRARQSRAHWVLAGLGSCMHWDSQTQRR